MDAEKVIKDIRVKTLDKVARGLEKFGGDKLKSDGWKNEVSGMNTNTDKKVYTFFSGCTFLTDEELSSVYTGGGLGHKIVTKYADDMTRQWIHLQPKTKPDDQEKEVILEETMQIMDSLNDLQAESQFNLALKWQRLFGGSIIVIGTNDAKLNKELNLNKAKSVEYLKVVDRSQIELSQCKFTTEVSSPNFGKIEEYHINLTTMGNMTQRSIKVHYSRVLEFRGEQVPQTTTKATNEIKYWGMSCLQYIWEELKNMGSTMNNVASLMYELIVTVYKFEGLSNMLSEGNEGELLKRMEVIGLTKSVLNAVILDAEEEMLQQVANVGGVSDLIDRFMILLSAVSDYPVTKLFGRSPAGQNATGKSDSDNYDNMVQSKQKNELKPPLQRLVDILTVIYDTNEMKVVFNPLEQMTEKEEAEINKLDAETHKIQVDTTEKLINLGVLDAEEVSDLEEARIKIRLEKMK